MKEVYNDFVVVRDGNDQQLTPGSQLPAKIPTRTTATTLPTLSTDDDLVLLLD
jgi:hypothetical protein